MRGQRVQDGQATRDHRAPLVLQAGQAQLVDPPGTQALLHQPAQALGRDAAVSDVVGREQLRDRAHGARGAQRLVPVIRCKRPQRFFQLGPRCHLGGTKGLLGVTAVAKIFHRQADAADAEGFRPPGLPPLAQDHLGGAPADVDHQARQVGRLQPCHPGVDQPRLLTPRDHLDGMAEHRAGPPQKGIPVARFAQRLGGHRAHLGGGKTLQPLCEPGQAGQATAGGFFGEQALRVEPGAQAHGLLHIVEAPVAALLELGDLQPEAVRSDVDCSQLLWQSGGCGQGLGCVGSHALIVDAKISAPSNRRPP